MGWAIGTFISAARQRSVLLFVRLNQAFLIQTDEAADEYLARPIIENMLKSSALKDARV